MGGGKKDGYLTWDNGDISSDLDQVRTTKSGEFPQLRTLLSTKLAIASSLGPGTQMKQKFPHSTNNDPSGPCIREWRPAFRRQLWKMGATRPD